jgi:hypothetical protein
MDMDLRLLDLQNDLNTLYKKYKGNNSMQQLKAKHETMIVSLPLALYCLHIPSQRYWLSRGAINHYL